MSRFTGSEFKVSRRLGFSITETGKELRKRNFAPGQHGKRRGKLSEYEHDFVVMNVGYPENFYTFEI